MTMKRGTFVYRIFFLFRLHPCLNGNYFLLKKEKDTGTYDWCSNPLIKFRKPALKDLYIKFCVKIQLIF